MANEENLTEETTEVVEVEVTETESEGTTESSEDVAGVEMEYDTEEDGNKVLVAVYPILFLSHQYKVGDILPTNYPAMVEAWIEAGTAVWRKEEQEAPKAKQATSEPGLSGEAVSSESESGENLVGKVPKTRARSKK